MILIGWITIFLFGLSVINIVSYNLSLAEKCAFSLPMGFGINSILLFTADLCQFSINSINSILTAELSLFLLLSILTVRKHKIDLLKKPYIRSFHNLKFPRINFAYLFLTGVMFFILYILIKKSLFWPIFQFDSITGFDFVAKAIAHEGTLNNSLFNKENPIYSIRSLYPPLVPINFAFSYLIGHESSQIVVLVFFLCTIFSFYLILKTNSTHLCAALFTLLLLITPEYAAFATLSSSNIPSTFYSSIGLLCLYLWYSKQKKEYFNIGTTFLVLAIWTRSEAIVFVAGGVLMILANKNVKNKILLLSLLGIPSLFALIIWQWYVKDILGAASAQPIAEQLIWEYDKLYRMLNQVKLVTFSTQYYGITVLLFLAMILINLKNIFIKKDNIIFLSTIFISWAMYISIFYLMDSDFKSYTMDGWIFSGYKRGLFSFFPLLLFYSSNNLISRKLFTNIFDL